MDEQDLFAVLEVERGASSDDIRKAYRRLARQYHPDVNPNDPQAEERFKQISFAYDVLSDEEKRKLYEEFGMTGLAEGFDPEQARAYSRWSQGASRSPFSQQYSGGGEFGDLGDILSELFGGGRAAGGMGGPLRGRGPDAQGEVAVDFLDAARGGEVRVQVQRDGGPRSLVIQIPPGARDGTRIRLSGQGGAGAGGAPAGDLYLTLRVRPHPFFTRRGDDLLLDLPVTLPELIRGAEVKVPTVDRSVTMTIPARSQNGRKLRLRGRGARRGEGESGDLIVTLIARLPEPAANGELDAVAEQLADLYGDENVRAAIEKERAS